MGDQKIETEKVTVQEVDFYVAVLIAVLIESVIERSTKKRIDQDGDIEIYPHTRDYSFAPAAFNAATISR